MLDKKTPEEIKILREGGKILGQILRTLGSRIKLGMTGKELASLAEAMILKAGGQPSFKNYQGFPSSLCVSLNETVVHGIPDERPFKNGDVIGLDIGMAYRGLHTDTALTLALGKVSPEVKKFLKITKQALDIGLSQVAPGKDISDIGRAIEAFVKPYGYGIVRDLAGHGVGRAIHEEPLVPNYSSSSSGGKMFPGLVIAIEPMLTMGGDYRIKVATNKWNVNSWDNSLTAHFEHTVAVTKTGYLIITK
jgi:methionyl aminopeptidase